MKKQNVKNLKVGKATFEVMGEEVTRTYKFFKSSNTEKYMIRCLKDMAGHKNGLPREENESRIKNAKLISFEARPLTQEEYDAWYATREWEKKLC